MACSSRLSYGCRIAFVLCSTASARTSPVAGRNSVNSLAVPPRTYSWGQRAIARELHISRNTVQYYVSSPAFPERVEGSARRASKKNKLDPYLPYLRAQWNAGIHTNSRLFAEIKERGYTGCQSLLRRLLTEWRTELPPKRREGSPRKPRLFAQKGQRRLSSRSASFLMILP